MYERKIREAGEISQPRKINEKSKTFAVLNRDNGNYVKTSSWKTLFMKMGNHQNVPYDVKIMTLTFVTFWLTFVTSGWAGNVALAILKWLKVYLVDY